jgi:hypothetical protein
MYIDDMTLPSCLFVSDVSFGSMKQGGDVTVGPLDDSSVPVGQLYQRLMCVIPLV